MSGEERAIKAVARLLIDGPFSFFHRNLPLAVIAFGALLTVGWFGLLGYGILEFAKLAF
jgi:hypothetical protein